MNLTHLITPQQLLLVQILSTAMMTGLIWFVQIVHYPLFTKVPEEGFTAYERSHTVRTGWVVAPIMLVELVSALAFLLSSGREGWNFKPAGDPLNLMALGCLALIWISTFLIQVPFHGILEKRPDRRVMNLLASTNWIRTVLWTTRLGLLAGLVSKSVTP